MWTKFEFHPCLPLSGKRPITLTTPDRSVIQQQKLRVSTCDLMFFRGCLEHLNGQGVPTPLSLQIVCTLMIERLFVERFGCPIRPVSPTGSPPVKVLNKFQSRIILTAGGGCV
jgi:hypothetical protein